MRKQQILLTNGPLMVLSSLLEKMDNGLEYPSDCYMDTPDIAGIYLHNPLALLKLKDAVELNKRLLIRKNALINISNITAEVDGMVFDAGEKSQSRISIRLSSMEESTDVARWKLSNNTWADITKEQFLKVLVIAAEKSTKIMEGQD